jgi:hypothetical protein
MTVPFWVAAFCLYGFAGSVLFRQWQGIVYGIIGGLLLWKQVIQIWRRRVFEVTPAEVRVGYATGTRVVWIDRWRRRAVGEVRLNRFTGDLLIRITGRDMKEYFISRDLQAAQRVADELDAALRAD